MIPIPTDFMQAIVQEVEKTEKRLQAITGFPVKVRLELRPEEINETVLQTLVCDVFDVTWSQVMSKSRDRQITFARHAYCYFSKLLFKKSLKTIGKEIGDRDHTTVLHSIQNVKDMVETKHDLFVYSYEKIHKKVFYEAEAN